ncbi:hypothetical protein llap_537 [Limosa lapponica baueri]|uniref:Uncharacterized protein n=1 Tax=Limosa lapponica baueri TaxID=1758121 RepID=A0A2I0USR0_LIMLA|nr:hypothetical protein llap_537 [Limosa lapponica baueri]
MGSRREALEANLRNPQACIWLSRCHLSDSSLASWLTSQLLLQFQMLHKAVHSNLAAGTGQSWYGGQQKLAYKAMEIIGSFSIHFHELLDQIHSNFQFICLIFSAESWFTIAGSQTGRKVRGEDLGLSHSSPFVHAVLVLQDLLADLEPSTAQTPDGMESCRRQIGGPEALLVLRDHFWGLLPTVKERIRMKLAAAFPEAPGLP